MRSPLSSYYFKLDGHKPVPCRDVLEWGHWFEAAERIVKNETVAGATISTVFLGIDHNFGFGPPLLFETMIFGGEEDGYTDRCSTWEQAERMHRKAVRRIAGPKLRLVGGGR